MSELIKNETKLFKAIDHGEGQALICEAMLLAYHNAYHLSEVIVLKKYFKPAI